MTRQGGLGSLSIDHPAEKRRCNEIKKQNQGTKKVCHSGTSFFKIIIKIIDYKHLIYNQ